jgi:hypothetical protein
MNKSFNQSHINFIHEYDVIVEQNGDSITKQELWILNVTSIYHGIPNFKKKSGRELDVIIHTLAVRIMANSIFIID